MSDSVMPATYGDVTAEYLALRNGCGLVAGHRELVWARGPDAVTFLDGLLSQDIAGIAPGAVAPALLLAPQGKLRAVLTLLRGVDNVGLVADAGIAGVAAGDLARYRIRVDVEIEEEPTPLLELWGPNSATVLNASGLPVPEGWAEVDGTLIAAVPLGGLERYLVAGVDASRLKDAGATPAGSLAAGTVRIEAGEPVMGIDVDEATIPQESGLVERSVSFTKGCYLGQELVARIDSRGRVNRHLRGLQLESNVLPPLGASVATGDRVVGTLTSLGESLELRAPIGLGLLRREVEPGDQVSIRWDGGSAVARVRELPFDDFAPS